MKHFEAKMSSKGQLTVPAELRRLLGLEEGHIVDFLWDARTRQVNLRARNLSVDALFGCVGIGNLDEAAIDDVVSAEVDDENRAAMTSGRTTSPHGEAAE